MNRKLVIIISIAFAAVAVAAGIIVIAVFGGKSKNTDQATPDQATVVATPDEAVITTYATYAPTAAPTAAEPSDATVSDATDPDATGADASEQETAADTEQASASAVGAPDELKQLLEQNGNTPQELYDQGCRQLITVESMGASASINYYTVEGGEWVLQDDLSCDGFVGSNGVTDDMHEGGYASPRGLYSIGEAFYINDLPQTGLETFQITPDTYWVDDPDSKYYNRRVEGTDDQDWSSAEHMIECSPAYDYGFVINYNTAAEYNKGSAIFFHISSGPTAGCIGTSQGMVLRYLAALDASQNPYILIL